jgi:hypothetical protein
MCAQEERSQERSCMQPRQDATTCLAAACGTMHRILVVSDGSALGFSSVGTIKSFLPISITKHPNW